MKLFLTSIGLSPEIAPHFLKIIAKSPKNFKVAFIPTAADTYDDKWFVKKDIENLTNLGFHVDIVDLKADPAVVRSQLEKHQIVYVGGGNTFYLLHWLRLSGVSKYLPKLLKNGYYIGASAGSIVTGPDIESAAWKPDSDENIVHLKDTTGLNLTDFTVYPHFEPRHLPYLNRYQKKISYRVIPISDSQAVYVNNAK